MKILKKIAYFGMVLAICTSVLVACKGEDSKPAGDTPEGDEAIQEMLDQERAKQQELSDADKRIIKAYEEDKTTIKATDIDQKDTTYTARLKKLYTNENNERLAVVYGLKMGGKMGKAIVQKEGGEAITLPQTGEEGTNYTFASGQNSLTDNGDQITLKLGGKTGVYNLVK